LSAPQSRQARRGGAAPPSSGSGVALGHEALRLLPRPHLALELGFLEGGEDLAETRTRGVAEGDQVVAAEEAWRADVLAGGPLRAAALAELDVAEIAGRGERGDARGREQLVGAERESTRLKSSHLVNSYAG